MNPGLVTVTSHQFAGYRKQETGDQKVDKPSYLTSKPQTKEHTPSPDFKPRDTSNLQVGQKVEHQKFGLAKS
jgi:DNA helicase-2/ATP-dependent DNA helicase PcrA